MKFRDILQRRLARIYLRYFSVLFCIFAGISLVFKQSGIQAGKKLLILKPDAIGDYILLRNFLMLIRKSEIYRNYEITFCGNSAYSEFANHYDGDTVDKFLWIDKTRVYLNLLYYIRLARTINNQYSVTIHASRSRELIFDYLAKISSPLERISHNGDTVNILGYYKKISDRWYTRLIHSGDIYSFEFDANRHFFETLLGHTISLRKPVLEKEHYTYQELPELPQEFVVLFPGAQLPFRRWKTNNFAAVCNHIRQKYHLKIIILGGKTDQKLADEIIRLSHEDVIDLTGKTSMKQLPALISKARLLITNDTMAVHIGAALDITSVVISQLNHYRRFVPYPREILKNMICVIPITFQNSGERALVERFQLGSEVDINLIKVDQVNSAIDCLLT